MSRKVKSTSLLKTKLRVGDEVIVIAGHCKGQRGAIRKILPKTSRVLVEGVNFVKKCIRANPQTQTEGRIAEKEAPLAISNVAIFNPGTNKADRIGFRFLEDGSKRRYFKSNKEQIEA